MAKLVFGSAAEGQIPDQGGVSGGRFLGKAFDSSQAWVLAAILGHGVASGALNPVAHAGEMNTGTKITRVAPGGRAVEDLAKNQIEGTVAYKPQDMFGATSPS